MWSFIILHYKGRWHMYHGNFNTQYIAIPKLAIVDLQKPYYQLSVCTSWLQVWCKSGGYIHECSCQLKNRKSTKSHLIVLHLFLLWTPSLQQPTTFHSLLTCDVNDQCGDIHKKTKGNKNLQIWNCCYCLQGPMEFIMNTTNFAAMIMMLLILIHLLVQ